MVEKSFRTALPDAVYAMKRYENWGDMHRLQLKHILGNIPVLGRRFQFCDLPADGSVNSVMKTAHAVTDEKHGTFYGANARYVSRMKDMDENYFVLLGGQDGWLGSDYFLDHVPLWNSGAYIRIPLRLNEIRKSFSTHLRLVPER
jgi:penicillin amidase